MIASLQQQIRTFPERLWVSGVRFEIGTFPNVLSMLDIQENNALKKEKENGSDVKRQRPLHAVPRLRSGKSPVSDARLPSPLGTDLDF